MAKDKAAPAEAGTETRPARPVITVTAVAPRRRAGFAFGPTPVHLTGADLDEDTVALLKADPHLSIRPYEAPEPEGQTTQE